MKALSAFEQAELQLEIAELKEECARLRAVYWLVRRLMRYNEIDKGKTVTAIGRLRDAVDSVMSLDSRREDL